ncbi:MAG TPA: hypothetical protein VED18_10105 [Candidatus Sulfotelmatobacter sp.]|nr:hypothetical protein [Candidatus Sulfotelmatobacter sp.]
MNSSDENRRARVPILLAALVFLSLSAAACSSVGQVLGFGTGEGDQKDKVEVIDRADPNEYILVKNPRYLPGGGPGVSAPEPEYIWVKRKDAPFDVNAFIRGKKAIEANPEEEARFASAKPADAVTAPRPDERFFVPPDQLKPPQPQKAQPQPTPQKVARRPDPATLLYPVYGYVVYVKGKQVYTDLTEESAVAAGNTVIIYREGEELKHPVTGAVLGRAEDEIGRARIVEVGEKTSMAEITEVKDGEEIRAKDKVKLIRAN